MELALIAAVARNGAIGRDNALLWRLPADLQHFKRTTMGAPVVMGRKTWDSLPAAFRPLPGRRNLVVTRNPGWHAPGAEPRPSLDAALDALHGEARVFVIGGGELYAQALPRADRLVLTEIDADFDADAFFPSWDRAAFVETSRTSQRSDAGWRYDWVEYRRRRG
ncbi:MAG TPA: dihydrofolate reductase [Methylibium sp.]|uniref:dihydrofolate reductase n=1 Tax=Methylibium sp. TaxID=2067992 RepID=UPI002DB62716|nr:dihydrofolate reductase [Methylibium sp.]HEU4460286.1 dihydrofolate reductase [Methylibium sp.]